MAFEKDLVTIVEIKSDIEKLRGKLEDFACEIETEDVGKSLKQVKTLYNTVDRIVNHLCTLTTENELKEYIEEKKSETKKELDLEYAIKRVRKALCRNNMIDQITLNLHKITKEDMEMVCNHFGIDYYVGSHGMWTWISFVDKDNNHLTTNKLIEVGLMERLIEEDVPKMETKEKIEKEELETLPWGWLSPTGDFVSGDFGEHEEKAIDIIKEKGFKEEFRTWKREDNGLLARDFLTNVKGYVLLHNPYIGGLGGTIASYEKKPTKKQCEFLYDYFLREKDEYQANFFLEMV